VINVGTLIFYIRIPETKDRSLATVEEELKLRFTGQTPLTRP
jgi:hypothetical protein